MSTVCKYRLFCSTDSKDEYVWNDSEPTTCPTNVAHTIDTSKTVIVQTIDESIVKIDENVGTLGGHYKARGQKMIIPDNVSIGQIITNVSDTDTIIHVDQDTIDSDSIRCNEYIGLQNGTTTVVLGRIQVIDRNTNQIFIEKNINSSESFDTFIAPCSILGFTTYKDFIQPYDIGVLSFKYTSSSENNGDTLDVEVYPNTTIGSITQNTSIGDTIIHVSHSVIDNIKIGYHCMINSGNITESLGYIVEMDTVNNTITVENQTIKPYLVSTPSLINISVKTLETDDIGEVGHYVFGEDKVGSSKIIKNKAVRVHYSNLTGGAKKFCFNVGYLY